MFLYYIPGAKTINEKQAEQAGLSHTLIEGGFSSCGTTNGPDKKGGVIFANLPPGVKNPPRVGYYPDKQVWKRFGSFWVGYQSDRKPEPGNLKRDKMLDGYLVKLADGNEYLVPVARAVDGSSPLPRRIEWDGSSWSPGEVMPRYADLFAEACRLWDIFAQADDGVLTFDNECDLAAMALAVNYRLGPAEISILGLFDTENEQEILLALVDWPALAAVKKKLESGELTLPPGVKD